MPILIQDYMINELHLSGNSLVLYAYMSKMEQYQNGIVALSSELGIPLSTLRRVIKELEKRDLIEVQKGSSKKDMCVINCVKMEQLETPKKKLRVKR